MHRSAHLVVRTVVPTALAALLLVCAGPFVHAAVARQIRTGADLQRTAGNHQTDRVKQDAARGALRAGSQHRHDGGTPSLAPLLADPVRRTTWASPQRAHSQSRLSRTPSTQDGRAPPA